MKDVVEQLEMDEGKVRVRFAHDLTPLKSVPLRHQHEAAGSVGGYGEERGDRRVRNTAERGDSHEDEDCENGEYTEKSKILAAIDSTSSMQNTGSVLDTLSTDIFKQEHDSNKIIVYLTDEEVENFPQKVEAIRRMKESGVRMLSVGLGGKVDPIQLMALASNDASWLDYYLFNYFAYAPSKQKVHHLENLEAFFLHKTPQHPQQSHLSRALELYTGPKFTYRGNMNQLSTSLCR